MQLTVKQYCVVHWLVNMEIHLGGRCFPSFTDFNCLLFAVTYTHTLGVFPLTRSAMLGRATLLIFFPLPFQPLARPMSLRPRARLVQNEHLVSHNLPFSPSKRHVAPLNSYFCCFSLVLKFSLMSYIVIL